MQTFRMFIVFLILAASSSEYLFSQDTTIIDQDNHLRAYIKLVNVNNEICPCKHEDADSMYKFEIIRLYGGEYSFKFIYVCVSNIYIYQFQRPKKLNNDYWWVLLKTDKVKDGIPVYKHGGNF
jgi:hypothetical protein